MLIDLYIDHKSFLLFCKCSIVNKLSLTISLNRYIELGENYKHISYSKSLIIKAIYINTITNYQIKSKSFAFTSYIIYFQIPHTPMQSNDKAVLSKCPQLEYGSDEWKQIEFKLQLSLGTASAVIKRIYDISNPHVAASFSNFSKGRTVLESFIST